MSFCFQLQHEFSDSKNSVLEFSDSKNSVCCVLCVYVFTFEVSMNFFLCVFIYHVQSLENFVENVEMLKTAICGSAKSL